MTPEQIRDFIAEQFPELTCFERQDGFSFYLRPLMRGANPNRILRAARYAAGRDSKLRLAVTYRLRPEPDLRFGGDNQELRRLVEREIRLYHENFRP